MLFFIQLLLLLVLLLLSGFFSGSETALFSLNNLELRKMKRKFSNTVVIEKLLKKPYELLTTILIGNLLVNIGLSSTATYIAIKIFGRNGVGISIILITFLLLIAGEISPKTLAIKNAPGFASFSAKPLNYFHKLVFPMRKVFIWVGDYFITLFTGKIKEKESLLSRDEIETIIKVGKKEGVIEKEEERMFHYILSCREIPVSKIMVPRVDVKSASIQWSRKKLVNFIHKTKHSKIPIYEKSEDKIIGVIYSKDVLLNPDIPFQKLIKPAIYVPETKTIDSLFEIFQKEKRRIAIVIDEYGGTSGIVTLEDILEEIFGEIYDEYEIPEVLIKKLKVNKYRIRGKTPVREINDLLNLDLPDEEFDTIAGFLLSLFQKIPEENEKCNYRDLTFTVEKIINNRIVSLLMEKR
ncbi:hemolysin [candidate division KSB1 bacterium]|nr:MAG: hemolysin [candidate division KSB1 bacterium]